MTNEEANLTIDYLKDMQEGYIEGEGYERHPLPEWYALDKAIEAVEQTRWIPISERPPEEDTHVIVTIGKGEERSVTQCMYSENSIFWKEYVVAWKPYPKPWKEEEE